MQGTATLALSEEEAGAVGEAAEKEAPLSSALGEASAAMLVMNEASRKP